MTWAEKHSGGKKLTITLICQSPRADALKIYALATHPDVEKLYVIPCYEQIGKDARGFSSRIYQNITLFGGGMYTPNTKDQPFAIQTQSFSGYDAKARIDDYVKQVKAHGSFENWKHGAILAPKSLARKDVESFIAKALGDNPYATRPTEVEIDDLEEKLLIYKDTDPIKRFGHRPIPFSAVAESDLICCDVLHGFDFLSDHFPKARFLNDPQEIDYWDQKTSLPELASATDGGIPASHHAYPGCWNISSVGDLDRFAEAYGEPVVLKDSDSMQGKGIYKASREDSGQWMLSYNKTKVMSAEEWLKFAAPALAMQWLEPRKGDVRVLCVDGEIIGAYNRLPKRGSELCNRAQGGTPEPYRLSHAEEAMLKRAAAELAKHGQRWVGFDLLADKDGRRYISEINLSNVGGIDTIHDYSLEHHAGKPAALKLADALVATARSLHQNAPAMAR